MYNIGTKYLLIDILLNTVTVHIVVDVNNKIIAFHKIDIMTRYKHNLYVCSIYMYVYICM